MVYEDALRCIGVCENVVFTVEDAEPTLQYLDELCRVVLSVSKQGGKGLGVLFAISSRSKPPSDEARAKIERDRRLFDAHTKAAAHVLFGEGFLASAKRSALSLLFATSRTTFPLKVFGDVNSAMLWLFKSMADAAPRSVTASALAASVDELCRIRFKAPSPAGSRVSRVKTASNARKPCRATTSCYNAPRARACSGAFPR
jgi:hypothetical protein